MQRMLLTVALLALLGASGLFVGVQTASAQDIPPIEIAAMAGQEIAPVPVVVVEIPEGMGTRPFTYSIAPDLPAGLTLDSDTGTISGTPTAASEATS